MMNEHISMEKYKVSVIVPSYNPERTIERTLNSILRGEYKNIEVLIVNDGSTDSTADIVKSLMEQDDRVRMTLETAKTRMNTGFFARPYCS